MEENAGSSTEASPAVQATKRRWCFKTVVLGDSGVGKTWLVETALTSREALVAEPTEHLPNHQHQFYHQHQQQQQQHQQQQQLVRRGDGDTDESGTIGVTFNLAKLELDGSTALLQVWDTSGKDRYRGLLANYMTDLSCVVIAYNPCSESAEASCQSLARWHQFAMESSVQTSKVAAAAPAMFCVVAIGGDVSSCRSPQSCDHVRCLAAGRVFAESLRGSFFHCRRCLDAGGGGAKCEWIGGQELTARQLVRELLRRHLASLARLMEQEEAGENCGGEAAAMKATGSCCHRLARRLHDLARWPVLATFLFGKRLMSRA